MFDRQTRFNLTIRPGPDFYRKESGRAGFFVIHYFLLHAFFTHYYLPPGIRWKRNITEILIKHKFVYFDTHKGLTVKIYIIFGVYTAAMGFTSTQSCWFLLIKNVAHKK